MEIQALKPPANIFAIQPLHQVILATILLFLGRAWQGWFFDLPLEDVLWDERLMAPFLQRFAGMTWEDYASTETADNVLTAIDNTMGWFWAVCALGTVGIFWKPQWFKWLMLPGAASLFILSLFYWKENFKNIGQLWEYSLQFCTPILLWVALGKGVQSNIFQKIALLATAVTFACHGLYAAGIYPQPGEWRQWCMVVFFMSDHTAIIFLKIMGILDFLAAAILLIPVFGSFIKLSKIPVFKTIIQISLWYCVVWGLMTALARLVAPLDYAEGTTIAKYLHQNLFEFLVRLPHAVIPFILLKTIPLSLLAPKDPINE